jgi:hypothetical protein
MTRPAPERLTAWIEQAWQRMEAENPTQTLNLPPGRPLPATTGDDEAQGDLFTRETR